MPAPSDKARRLSKMKLGEVSLVDAGANQHARAVIVKRAGEEHHMPKPNEIDLESDEIIFVDEEGKPIELSDEEREALLADDDDGEDGGDEDDDDVVYLDGDDDGDEDGDVDIDAVLAHNAETITEQGDLLQKQADYIEELEETVTKYAGRIEKIQKGLGGEDADDEDVFKGATPELRERFLKMEQKQNAAELAEEIAKARGYGVGDAKALAPALMRIRKLCPNEAKVIEKALATAGGVIAKSGLLRTVGETGEAAEGSAISKARALAGEIKKSASAGGRALTDQQAIAQVWVDHPDLYQQHIAERAH